MHGPARGLAGEAVLGLERREHLGDRRRHRCERFGRHGAAVEPLGQGHNANRQRRPRDDGIVDVDASDEIGPAGAEPRQIKPDQLR